jgi:hypothetical protein
MSTAILSSFHIIFLEWLGKSMFFLCQDCSSFVCQEIFLEGARPAWKLETSIMRHLYEIGYVEL